MALEKLGVRAVVEGLSRFTRDLKKMDKSIEDVGDASTKTGRLSDNLAQNWTKLAAVAGSLGAAIFAAKKYFDFAEEGAQLLRLEQSGESLARSFGISMDRVVEAVDKASRGTVSRADIIQAANRAMLLGVADSAEKMAQLMEVAAVRGKAMGLSTTQAFNDIVTGIGRASPMILDNLGIVTGGEKVYVDFAESIGKAKDELTDTEKKTALFNAVMESTAPLITEASGQADDLATSYEQLHKEIADLTDLMKKELAEATGDFVKDSVQSIKTSLELNDIVEELGITMRAVAGEYRYIDKAGKDWGHTQEEVVENYKKMTERANKYQAGMTLARDIMGERTQAERTLVKAIQETKEEAEELAKAEEEVRKEREKIIQLRIDRAYKNLSLIMKTDLTGAYEDMLSELESVGKEEVNLKERIEDVNEKIADYRSEIRKIKAEEGPITENQKERIADYNKRIVDAQGELAGLRDELGKVPNKIDEVREAWDRQTKEMIFDLAAQRLALDGLTTEELKALSKLAGPEGFGLIDEASRRLIEGIGLAADEMDKTGDQSDIFIQILEGLQSGIGNTETAVDDLTEAINNIPTTTKIKFTYDLPMGRMDRLLPFMRQHGGPVARGMPYLVGERGPELFIPSISGNVLSNMMTRAMGQINPSITNTQTSYGDNLSLNIYTSAPTEDIVADFRMMKSLGSRI